MSYFAGIVATTVACAVAVTLCSGGKHEKLCTSVSLALIALSAVLPLRSVVDGDLGARLEKEIGSARKENEESVIEACEKELERRLEDAVEERFDGCDVLTVSLSFDESDLQNVRVTG